MIDLEFPIKLENNRVWRTYQGGSKLNKLQNDNKDLQYAEEWIASTVCARMVGRDEEGASQLSEEQGILLKDIIEQNPEKCLGQAHIDKYGTNLGVLVKLID